MSYRSYISEADYHEKWRPVIRADGNFFEFKDVKSEPPGHVWTVVESGDDSDGNWYASPGFHVVNRLGYVITENPWVDETLDAIYFLDDCDQDNLK